MSMPTVPTSASGFSLTGNPAVDNLIRTALLSGSVALTAIIVTWLGAHGFTDPNLNLLISGAIFSVLAAGATALWGYLRSSHIGTVIGLHEAAGVTAGYNYAVSSGTGDGLISTVTPSAAKEVIKNYSASVVAVKS